MRQPIQDANEGTTRLVERKKSTKVRGGRATAAGDNTMGVVKGISKALATAAQTANDNYQQSAAAQAEVRQGADAGINEVDKANKRNGFMKYLFGEDAGYSTAVSTATKNFAKQQYVEELASTTDHADKTPEEYQAYLKESRADKIAELYQDDPEAAKIATNEWDSKSYTLAREQAAKHKVYSITQARLVGVQDTVGEFEEVAGLMAPDSTAEARQEGADLLAELVDPEFSYVAEDGTVATPEASRGIQVDAVVARLNKGDTNLIHALPDNFAEKLTPEQAKQYAQGRRAYDDTTAMRHESIVEVGLLASAEGDVGGIKAALDNLEAEKGSLSGTDRSKEGWFADKTRLTKALHATMKSNSAKYESAVVGENLLAAYQGNDVSSIAELDDGTKKTHESTGNALVMQIARGEDMKQSLDILLNDPGKLKLFAKQMGEMGMTHTGIAKAMQSQVRNLVATDANGDGLLDDEARAQLNSMQQVWNENPTMMRKALGTDADAVMQITIQNQNEPIKNIQSKVAAYQANKDKPFTSAAFNIPSGQSIRDFIQSSFPDQRLNNASLSYYQQQLKTGWAIYDGDPDAARNYMKDSERLRNGLWKGINIENAAILETNSSYVGDIGVNLSKVDGSPIMQAIIERQMPAEFQDTANPIMSITELPDKRMWVDPSTEILYIDSSRFNMPIAVDAKYMGRLAMTSEVGEKEKARRDNLINRQVAYETGKYHLPVTQPQ
ncbi:hypothetical protein VPHK436_0050 [Vibrio phage K436]